MENKKYELKNELKEYIGLTKRDIPMWISVALFCVGFASKGITPLLIITFSLSLVFCFLGSLLLFIPNKNVSKTTNFYRIFEGIVSIMIAVGLMAFKLYFFLNRGLY